MSDYKPVTDDKFWKKLTKKEILHLLIDGAVKDLKGLNRNFKHHSKWRAEKPASEPCWDCKAIARKLGAIE